MTERAFAVVVVVVALAACGGGRSPASAPAPAAYDPAPTVIAGAFPTDRGPDGNSIILAAPRGLIVVDTGRQTEHQDKLLAFAKQAGAPIAAIINTHWHLDHSGGNAELRAGYPGAGLSATHAVEGALVGFFPRGRAQGEALLASGKATPQQIEDIKLGRQAIEDTRNLLPSRPITQSGAVDVAGRTLDLRVA